jgi:hypothetical protein
MPSITFYHLASGLLQAGETHGWTWNNIGSETVRPFSVDAQVPPLGAYPGQSAKVEITRVQYRQTYDGSSFKRQVAYWVKNTGSGAAYYYVHMAVIKE